MEKALKALRENRHIFSDWVEYVAWDSNGRCWEYGCEPYIGRRNTVWMCNSDKFRKVRDNYFVGVLDGMFDESNWKGSLFCLKTMTFV